MARPQIPLSPIDHVFLGEGAYPIQFLFYYPNKLDRDRLARGLKRIESQFWPVLRGRLNLGGTLVCCEDIGQSIKIEERQSSDAPPNFNNARELAPYAVDIDLNSALAALTITQLPSGSLLSVNIAHCLVDGYSFFYFLSLWANATKNPFYKRLITKHVASPNHQRDLLIAKKFAEIPPEDKLSDWLFNQTGISYAQPRQGFSIDKSQWSQFELTKEDIKSKVNLDFEHPREIGLSWHDLISALIWRKTAFSWPHHEKLRICSAFDFRRVFSSINHRYFGNAVRGAGLEKSWDDVTSQDIVTLARSIRQSTACIDRCAIQNTLSVLGAMWQKYGLTFSSRVHVSHPDIGLLVTNLSRLPSDQLDFGSGKPTMIAALTPAPRTAVITAGSNGAFQVRLSEPL